MEPTGESVIAGRSAPGATVVLLVDGKPHATVVADAGGLFAFVPPPVAAGTHEVTLEATARDGTRIRSAQSVTVVIATGGQVPPLVTVSAPGQPTVVVSRPDAPTRVASAEPGAVATERPATAPASPASAPATAGAASSAPPAAARPQPAASPARKLQIASVETEGSGRLYVSGDAAPGATIRLYLNDTFVAPAQAGADGRFAFSIERGIRPGQYRVRLDDVDASSGAVRSRAEVGFTMPAQAVAAAEPPPARADAPSSATSSDRGAGLGSVAGRETRTAPPSASPGPTGPPAAIPSVDTPSMASTAGFTSPATAVPVARPPAAGTTTSAAVGGPDARAPSTRTASVDGPVAAAPAARASADAPRTDRPAAAQSGSGAAQEGAAGAAIPAGRSTVPARTASAAHQDGPIPVVVPEISTAVVTRGESLWVISRREYGQGLRYTVIYGANSPQIRDPNLIYPGQVFVLPKTEQIGSSR